MKNILIIDKNKCIIFLSSTYPGSVHDKTIADHEAYTFPPDSILMQDMGFQGFSCDGVTIQQPKKKPRKGVVTDGEKCENQRISRIRIAVEHVISSIKRFRIVKDTCRMHYHTLDQSMMIACGLHNFIVRSRMWSVVDFKS